jgi:uncharacterized protein involved in exopolysaccharide biosynthesis
VFPDNSVTQRSFAATAIEDEIAIITSKETLYHVVEELQLVKKWEDAKSPSDAYGLLRDKVEVERIPDTSIVEIEVSHTDPKESADLANAIGKAYKDRRTETETTRATNALDMLNAQETLQEQKVENSRLRMFELMEKYDIVDLGNTQGLGEEEAGRTTTTTPQALLDAETAYHQKQRDAADLASRVDMITGTDEKLRIQWLLKAGLISDVARDARDEAGKIATRRALLKASGMGSETDLATMQKQIASLNRFVQAAASDALSLLAVENKMAKSSLDNLAEIVETLRAEIQSERKSFVQYKEAKEEYLIQSELQEEMRKHLLQQKIDLSLPTVPIEIHEIAEMNEIPSSPDVPVTLASNAMYNLLWSIPGGLIVMYFAMLYSARQERMTLDEIAEAIELEIEEEEAVAQEKADNW